MNCPGCGGSKSRRAKLCITCRRRAIAVGVEEVLAPTPADPRSAGQNSAFHGKCSTIAELELGAGATRSQISVSAIERKRQALAYASDRFGRMIESSTQLSRDEMSVILDWLDVQIAAAQ